MHMKADFEAFERVIIETHERQTIRILSYCVLSNHWHFVVWPEEDGQLTAFFRRLALYSRDAAWRVLRATSGRWGMGTYIKDDSRVSRYERGRPYGGDDWVKQIVTDLGLERTIRPEGRPRKASQ